MRRKSRRLLPSQSRPWRDEKTVNMLSPPRKNTPLRGLSAWLPVEDDSCPVGQEEQGTYFPHLAGNVRGEAGRLVLLAGIQPHDTTAACRAREHLVNDLLKLFKLKDLDSLIQLRWLEFTGQPLPDLLPDLCRGHG